jgi:hypothetical protein
MADVELFGQGGDGIGFGGHGRLVPDIIDVYVKGMAAGFESKK